MENGSVAEWLKAHDSKSCGQQCLGGSNPLASAKIKEIPLGIYFILIAAERMRTVGSVKQGLREKRKFIFFSEKPQF